jgi:hypothetical protein
MVAWRRCGIAGSAALLLGVTTPAVAQEAPPRLTVAVGFGQARPLASVNFINPTFPTSRPRAGRSWSVSLQVRATKHLLIDTYVAGWTDTEAFSGFVRTQANDGPLFRTFIDYHSQNGTRSAVIDMLATTAFGRWRVSSGAGFGLFGLSSSFSVTESQCDLECHSNSGSAAVSALGVQGILETDVRVNSRLHGFLSCRLTLPATLGFADIAVVGGVRVVVR